MCTFVLLRKTQRVWATKLAHSVCIAHWVSSHSYDLILMGSVEEADVDYEFY